MLALSFITFNTLMAYSLINKFKDNNEPLQVGAVLFFLAVAVAFLAFSLLYYQKRNRKSDGLERDRLKNEDYLVCCGIFSVFGSYLGSLMLVGVGTVLELARCGLNDDNNKILLAGVVGAVACSLLMALYSCVLEPLLSRKAESSKNSETIESVAVSGIEGSPRIVEQSL